MTATIELTRSLGDGVQAGLVDTGLLWALNEFVLHGQGYEVQAAGERLLIAGCGREVRAWPVEAGGAVDARWRQYRAVLLDAQTYNNPGYWEKGSSVNVKGRGR